MKRSILLLLFAIVAACHLDSGWEPAEPGDIFRFTVIGNGFPLDSIILGQSWNSAVRYGANADDTVFSLRPGTFAGADALHVHRDSMGVVVALEFEYGRSYDIPEIVEDYELLLGRPTSTHADTMDNEIREATVWMNSDTEFRITAVRSENGRLRATALLVDRRQHR